MKLKYTNIFMLECKRPYYENRRYMYIHLNDLIMINNIYNLYHKDYFTDVQFIKHNMESIYRICLRRWPKCHTNFVRLLGNMRDILPAMS